MSGFYAGVPDAWAIAAEAMAGTKWDAACAVNDLRWWADRVRMTASLKRSERVRFPTERDLSKRWGWSTRQVRKLRDDVEAWGDPLHMEDCFALLGKVRNRAPSWMDEAEQDRSRSGAGPEQDRSSAERLNADNRRETEQDRSRSGAEAEQKRSTTRAFPSTDPPITDHNTPPAPQPAGAVRGESDHGARDGHPDETREPAAARHPDAHEAPAPGGSSPRLGLRDWAPGRASVEPAGEPGADRHPADDAGRRDGAADADPDGREDRPGAARRAGDPDRAEDWRSLSTRSANVLRDNGVTDLLALASYTRRAFREKHTGAGAATAEEVAQVLLRHGLAFAGESPDAAAASDHKAGWERFLDIHQRHNPDAVRLPYTTMAEPWRKAVQVAGSQDRLLQAWELAQTAPDGEWHRQNLAPTAFVAAFLRPKKLRERWLVLLADREVRGSEGKSPDGVISPRDQALWVWKQLTSGTRIPHLRRQWGDARWQRVVAVMNVAGIQQSHLCEQDYKGAREAAFCRAWMQMRSAA